MFSILAERSIHEGGTKFYTLVRILNTDTQASVMINNWGPKRSMPAVIADGGESQIMFEPGLRTASEYSTKKSSKRGRGYSKWATLVSKHGATEIELRDFLKQYISSKYFNDIFANVATMSPAAINAIGQDSTPVQEPTVKLKSSNPLRGSW